MGSRTQHELLQLITKLNLNVTERLTARSALASFSAFPSNCRNPRSLRDHTATRAMNLSTASDTGSKNKSHLCVRSLLIADYWPSRAVDGPTYYPI
jgi:hypothetical protein